MKAHVPCLGEYMLSSANEPNRCLPVAGSCPLCNRTLVWGDLIRGSQLR
jgi:hypothetical protein